MQDVVWAGHVVRMEEGRSAFEILTSKPTGKRPRRRQEDITRIDLKEIGFSKRNRIDSAQDTDCWRSLVYIALNLKIS